MNNINITAIVATLLNFISSNSIIAAAVIEHGDPGDVHQDAHVVSSVVSSVVSPVINRPSIEHDDPGDVHQDPPIGNNAPSLTSHL